MPTTSPSKTTYHGTSKTLPPYVCQVELWACEQTGRANCHVIIVTGGHTFHYRKVLRPAEADAFAILCTADAIASLKRTTYETNDPR